MSRLRRRLGGISLIWLLSQVGAMATVPLVFWSMSADALECRCVHGEHAYCPMHHRPVRDGRTCVIGPADSRDAAATSPLFIPAGLIPRPALPLNPTAPPVPPPADEQVSGQLGASPDSPPPRV